MAAQTTGAGVTILNTEQYECVWRLVRLVTTAPANWTLAGSGDGVGPFGGMGVDTWGSVSAANTATSWACIQAPNSNLQLLFARYNSTVTSWRLYADPLGAYIDGTYNTLPTSASAVLMHEGTFAQTNTNTRMHALVETGTTLATSGFVVLNHDVGWMRNESISWGFIPMSVVAPGETNPWVFYRTAVDTTFTYWDLSDTGQIGNAATNNGAKSIMVTDGSLRCIMPFGYQVSGRPQNSPYSVPAYQRRMSLQNLEVPMFPIMWGKTLSDDPVYGRYLGMSEFAQWRGYPQTQLHVLNNRTRVVIGDGLFPWDGSSIPLPS